MVKDEKQPVPLSAIRSDAMNWATRTASLGEDPLAVLARAQLYEEYVREGASASPLTVHSFAATQSR